MGRVNDTVLSANYEIPKINGIPEDIKFGESLSELIGKIIGLCEAYNEKRTNITDQELGELRAKLSILTLILVQDHYRIMTHDLVMSKSEFEKQYSLSFVRALSKEEGSPSYKKDIATKTYKADPEYLEAFENLEISKQEVVYLDRIIAQANQILNSMTTKY